jgi:integrase
LPARGVDRLSDAACRAAKPGAGIRKLGDGKGMYLAVMPTGSRLWRLKYRHGGSERVYSIGAYPEVGLAAARAERDKAREWLRAGKDPIVERKVEKANAGAEQADTFRLVAEEWLGKQQYSAGHRQQQRTLLDRFLLPVLGGLPVAGIKPPLVLDALRIVEDRGALELAAKCRRMSSQIFRYAVQTGRAESDPAALLAGAIKAPDVRHRATIPPKEMPALFKAVAAVPAELNTKLALYWLILTATRTHETRFATWGEVHGGQWRIPAERMKMRLEHVVPLSKQAQTIHKRAREIRAGDGADALLFPGFTRAGHLSENALLALLARAGYYGRQTSHGFRSAFSTWAHEVREADPDVIEACLAHVKEGVRGVYNRATYLSKRAALLQAWADQLQKWGMRLP